MKGHPVRIVVADDYQKPLLFAGPDDPVLARLAPYGAIDLYQTRPASRPDFLSRIKPADAIINVLLRSEFNEEAMAHAPNLKVISYVGAGPAVDLDAASRHHVAVCNIPGANSLSVAEFALGLMFAVTRTIPLYDRWMRSGRWERVVGRELAGKTLGLLGIGNIGGHLARLGRGVSMRVIGWSRRGDTARAAELGVELVGRDDLFRQSDVLSLHLRGTPDNQGVVGTREFALMKPTAVLINTARSVLVDHEALALALREGRLAGAGLDVHAPEPLPLDRNIFKDADNVVLAPHSGSETLESNDRLRSRAVENVIAFLEGRPQNVVNPP
jgi:phosphoglycerate dehydrogenase-like enzyme